MILPPTPPQRTGRTPDVSRRTVVEQYRDDDTRDAALEPGSSCRSFRDKLIQLLRGDSDIDVNTQQTLQQAAASGERRSLDCPLPLNQKYLIHSI